MNQNDILASLLGLAPKRRVFVSYHHRSDQDWYDRFSALFHDGYDVLTDRSLDRALDSESAEYLTRSIRENNITGSSVTIVLCGFNTWKRRWVDWEIDMTLNKEHALLGIVLPTQPWNPQNSYFWPERLLDNIRSGFAHWMYWSEEPEAVQIAIDQALTNAQRTTLIQNSRSRMKRSLS